jgi:hypothetical protein
MRVPFSHGLALWLYDELVGQGVLSRTAVALILQRYGKQIIKLGIQLQDQLDNPNAGKGMQPALLALSDRRYFAGPWMDKALDFQTLSLVDQVPPTLEGIMYNMTLLATREWKRLKGADHAEELERTAE